MPKPTLHLIAPFYSTLTSEWLHDGFTEEAFLFSRMMQARGYLIVEYAVEGSESDAQTKVAVMSYADHKRFFPAMGPKDTRPKATVGDQGWTSFNFNLHGELAAHVHPGDIVCHVFGDAHRGLLTSLPSAHHVEIGVGYTSGWFGAWRIFHSDAWRHYHLGQESIRSHVPDKATHKVYSWVIPCIHDTEMFEPGHGSSDTVVYFGRMDSDKGMNTIVEIIREHARMVHEGLVNPLKFAFAGRGNFDEVIDRQVRRAPNPLHKEIGVTISHVPYLSIPDRSRFLGNALCALAPTDYVEPFGSCAVQAMICGTPVLASDFGGYTETVLDGTDGYRCKTLGDWLAGIEACRGLYRPEIAGRAVARFSLESCGRKFDVAFQQIADLGGAGWMSRTSHKFTASSTAGSIVASSAAHREQTSSSPDS
jgi:glycosyltransferase involved in cell wall biosynthesis